MDSVYSILSSEVANCRIFFFGSRWLDFCESVTNVAKDAINARWLRPGEVFKVYRCLVFLSFSTWDGSRFGDYFTLACLTIFRNFSGIFWFQIM